MNDVPLVKDNKIYDINTSIIAIKKQLKQLNEAVGLIDIPDMPDLSPYIKKSDIVDAVTSGDMHPVTSNAVARVLAKSSGTVTYNSNVLQGLINWYRVGNCVYVRFERVVFLEYTGGDRNISADDQLPRPLYGITAIGNIPPLNANVQSQLIRVTPEGALGLGGGYSVANQYFYGGFTYLCAD